MEQIVLNNVTKEYLVAKKRKGMIGVLRGLIHSEKIRIEAVKGISCMVSKGEIIGFIGPNGAGKSTTIKMMTGIMHPTSEEIYITGDSGFYFGNESFFRGRQAEKGGIGIGLALSKAIIEKQNGTISARNLVEGGPVMKFVFTFIKT